MENMCSIDETITVAMVSATTVFVLLLMAFVISNQINHRKRMRQIQKYHEQWLSGLDEWVDGIKTQMSKAEHGHTAPLKN